MMQALLLPVGDDWYALELEVVREVLAAPATTSVPRAPSAVLGVFNLRGEVVPLLDTAALLGLPAPPHTSPECVVVADSVEGPAGLLATGLPRRAELGEIAGPATLPAGLGRFAAGEQVATLIDVEALVQRART